MRRIPTYSVGAVTTTVPPPDLRSTVEPPDRRPLFVAALYLLRVMATLQAALALTQALSIGQYLDGRYGLLQVHQIAAGLLITSGMLLAVVALGYVLSGGRVWVISSALLFLAEGVQTGLGYSRSLGVHVPLGVAIVALAVAVAIWSWTPAARRPRTRRSARPARASSAGELP